MTRARARRIARGRRGGSALGCLVPLLILTVIGYFAANASDAAFKYYRFRDAMQQEARFADRKTDDQIRTRLRAFVDSLELPSSARRISIRRTESTITISAEYTEAIEFPFVVRSIEFRPRAERRF